MVAIRLGGATWALDGYYWSLQKLLLLSLSAFNF